MVNVSWRSLRRNYLTAPMLLRSVPVGVVVASGVFANVWTHNLLNDHQYLVVHSYEVIDTTKDVLIGLDDAETGQRGYLLSGDRRYLDPYRKALERLVELRKKLKSQISDNISQVARVQGLDRLIDTKLGELRDSISLHDQEGFDAARRKELTLMELGTMDQIRHIIGDITESEKSLLASRQVKVENDEYRIRLAAILIGLASILTRAIVEMYLARTRLDRRRVPQSDRP